ncbi:CHC2 zinc finger domain-containing protein [Deltaproteobacteria bacterium]|nr:CHC2 zinc finger domain-containing protein [Deltaproteobacteria bacterium]
MSRAKQAADRIRADIPILRVLEDYGYYVHGDGGDREQQFSCDLHGDGQDSKPSARVYPDSDSWYCFACNLSRDAISTVRDKEGLDFWPAVKILERRYGLPALPWVDDEPRRATPEEEVRESLRHRRSWDDEKKRLRTLLETVTEDRDLPMNMALALWEGFDRICWMVDDEKGGWFEDERKGKDGLEKLRVKTLARLKESYA